MAHSPTTRQMFRATSPVRTADVQFDRLKSISATKFLGIIATQPFLARRARVRAALRAEAFRAAAGRAAEAAPPLRPPFLAGSLLTGCPRPEPAFLPPPVILFTVAQARRLASLSLLPAAS